MSITGNLRTLEFAELLQWLAQGQKTGALVISRASLEKRIFFKEGKIVSSESNNPDEHLGTFLIREGLIDEATLARAVKLQESTQILLGKVLVTLGTISEDELNGILQRKTEESLYELFTWTEGDFRFLPDELPRLPMVPLEIDVTNVVLEGAKRLDEARRDRQAGTDDYGEEIENVLSSDVFKGIEVSDSEPEAPGAVVEPMFDEPVAALESVDETAADEPVSAEVRGYYGGSGRRGKSRAPLLAAAAAIAAVAIGIGAYFFMRPDPAVGVADRESLSSPSVPEPAPSFGMQDLYLPPESDGEQSSAPTDLELPDAPPGPTPRELETEQMQARYEAELDSLKQQLAQAKLAQAERDAAMGRVAELEQQVEQTQTDSEPEAVGDRPEAQYRVASLVNPLEDTTLSAGGDELPPLGTPQQTTEADQEAGADFAAEMVDVAPVPQPTLDDSTAADAAEIEGQSEPVQVEPQISSPVLLTRPKPRYPTAAMRLGREAVVTLRLLIGTDGRVADVERVGPLQGMGFDKEAITAARNTRWQPATRDGAPVEMWTEMRISFRP